MKNIAPNPSEQAGPGASAPYTEDMRAVLDQQARFCRTMGHPMRLYLLHYLHEKGGEVANSELAEASGLPRASLSQHISQMTAAGLVTTRREGRYVHVKVARVEIGQACELVHKALRDHSQEGAQRYGSSSSSEQTPKEPLQ